MSIRSGEYTSLHVSVFYSFDSSNERCVAPTITALKLTSNLFLSDYVPQDVGTFATYMYMPDAVEGGKCVDTCCTDFTSVETLSRLNSNTQHV